MKFNLDYILKRNEKDIRKRQHEWPDINKKILRNEATLDQLKELEYLINNRAGETELHNFLETNEVVFSFALRDYGTGHDGLWVHSKQEILPRVKKENIKGLIPDFILGGENSNGHQWFVIELKGANESIFTNEKSSIQLTATANKGLCQLLEYTDACNEIQSHLRDHFRMHNFREPRGILLMGTEHEFKEKRKQRLKRALNYNFNKGIEIRTYNWLLRNFADHMAYRLK